MGGIADVGLGLQTGVALAHLKRLDDSVMAGGNAPMGCLFQASQMGYVDSQLSRVLEAAGMSSIPLPLRIIVVLSPVVLALGTKYLCKDPDLEAFLFKIQSQFGNLCQVASIVCSVTLIYFGSVAMGVTTLVMLGVGYLDEYKILPERMRHLLHDYSPAIMIGTGVLFGSLFEKLMAGVGITLTCVGKYFEWQDSVAKEEALNREVQNALSYDDFKKILNDEVSLEINRDFVHYSTLPPMPANDIEELNGLFEKIDWYETHETWNKKQNAYDEYSNIDILRKKLATDQRFQKKMGKIEGKTNEQLIEYARSNLAQFTKTVKTRTIVQGEPRDYERMEYYLKLVTHALPEEDEVTRTDALIRLAIEGGEYCGPGKFEVAEDLSSGLVYSKNQSDIPFRTKVLSTLQDERNLLFHRFYKQIADVIESLKNIPPYTFIDPYDIHIYNQIVNTYGSEIGLRKSAAENDSAAVVDPFLRYMIKRQVDTTAQFWLGQSPELLADQISDAFGSKLPRPELYEWIREWQERNGVKENDFFSFEDNYKILGRPVEMEVDVQESDKGYFAFPSIFSTSTKKRTRMVVDPVFLKAMLVDMGVLKIVPKKEKEKVIFYA